MTVRTMQVELRHVKEEAALAAEAAARFLEKERCDLREEAAHAAEAAAALLEKERKAAAVQLRATELAAVRGYCAIARPCS